MMRKTLEGFIFVFQLTAKYEFAVITHCPSHKLGSFHNVIS